MQANHTRIKNPVLDTASVRERHIKSGLSLVNITERELLFC